MRRLNAKILLVKEKLKDIDTIEGMVNELGFEVLFTSDVDSTGLALSFNKGPNLILCHSSQKTFFTEIKGTHLPIILITDPNERMFLSAASSHKIAYLHPPLSKDILNALIDLLLSTED
jgi:AmiR/NasT family two-component response regulator